MPLVFQYGSNTSSARLNSPERLDGAAIVLGAARTIEPFDLEFTVFSKTNGCAAANITPGKGRQIWGVLYQIPEEALQGLDSVEGVNSGNYRRQPIRVCRPAIDQPLDAITYVAVAPQDGLKTALHYVEHILRGLGAHPEIPGEYVEYIRARIRLNNPDLGI